MSGRTEDNVRDRNKLGTSLDMALMSHIVTNKAQTGGKQSHLDPWDLKLYF